MSTAANVTMSAIPTPSNRAPPQGGVIEGANPSKYNPNDPITLFIIQVGIILIVCHAFHWPLSKLRQPRVIAEVVGGIVLGPSVMGRVPGFKEAIFPEASIPNLSLVANLGLILYLFLIGLETDVRFLISNWRVATSVAFSGLAIPFGAGCGLAWGVYHAFRDDPSLSPIEFPVYMLFIGIAIAITAFPVLCRILTELKLLDTSVGIITLSAGVANDVVGWILLALCVTLVNAGNGLSALWILLACAGFLLFLTYLVRPALIWLLRRTGNLQNGPSQSIISLIVLVTLAASFFTGIIGVHPIFGAFMVGLIVPRDERFNIRVTEKLEDLIGALLLPLYFTLSGLKTNLGLLDSGLAWGYVFATTVVAFLSKIIGASAAARLNGLVWRESFTIGVLMSCKGLVELIVLNIGLQANILSPRTFTIFVIMALLTTFTTTPLVSWLYSPSYQKKIEAWKRGEIDWETGQPIGSSPSNTGEQGHVPHITISTLLVYLRLDTMPRMLNLLSLFGKPPENNVSQTEATGAEPDSVVERASQAVRAHGIRLLQLTDRDSSVMTVSQVEEYSRHDPVVNTFRTIAQLQKLTASGEVAIMPENRFAEALLTRSSVLDSDLLLVPWSETGSIGDSQILSSSVAEDKLLSPYTAFVKSVFQSCEQNVAVFFTRSDSDKAKEHSGSEKGKLTRAYSFGALRHGFPTTTAVHRPYHSLMPYFGGGDDELALRLILQLCQYSHSKATIVCASTSGVTNSNSEQSTCSRTAYDIAATKLTDVMPPHITFETPHGVSTMEDMLKHVTETYDFTPNSQTKLIVAGRHEDRKLDEGKAHHNPKEEVKDCFGPVASQFAEAPGYADILVVQAKRSS